MTKFEHSVVLDRFRVVAAGVAGGVVTSHIARITRRRVRSTRSLSPPAHLKIIKDMCQRLSSKRGCFKSIIIIVIFGKSLPIERHLVTAHHFPLLQRTE